MPRHSNDIHALYSRDKDALVFHHSAHFRTYAEYAPHDPLVLLRKTTWPYTSAVRRVHMLLYAFKHLPESFHAWPREARHEYVRAGVPPQGWTLWYARKHDVMAQLLAFMKADDLSGFYDYLESTTGIQRPLERARRVVRDLIIAAPTPRKRVKLAPAPLPQSQGGLDAARKALAERVRQFTRKEKS